jgi:hypothetical protein
MDIARTQQAVWRQWRCMLAESFVQIWKQVARPNNSEAATYAKLPTVMCNAA